MIYELAVSVKYTFAAKRVLLVSILVHAGPVDAFSNASYSVRDGTALLRHLEFRGNLANQPVVINMQKVDISKFNWLAGASIGFRMAHSIVEAISRECGRRKRVQQARVIS